MDLEKAGKIMIKTWEVRAEINIDASRYKTVTVKANTERKARQFAVEKLKADGAFKTNLQVFHILLFRS